MKRNTLETNGHGWAWHWEAHCGLHTVCLLQAEMGIFGVKGFTWVKYHWDWDLRFAIEGG